MGEFIALTCKPWREKSEKVSLTRPITKFTGLVSLYRKLNDQGLHLEQGLGNCLCIITQNLASERSLIGDGSPFFWRNVREMLDESIFHGLVASITLHPSLAHYQSPTESQYNYLQTSSLQSRTNCLIVLRNLSISKSVGLYRFLFFADAEVSCALGIS